MEVLKYLPLCRSQYIPLAVNITASTTNVELEDKISQEIEKRGRQNIYRFRIRGMRDPETEFDLENLTSKFRIVEILDESEPQYDFSALFAEHPSDMIGFYDPASLRSAGQHEVGISAGFWRGNLSRGQISG